MTDDDAMTRHGVDRDALLRRVAQAFAVQIFLDGFFNADPHPGNLLVQVQPDGTARPVLLDFGLCATVRPPVRLALAAMVHAADVTDFGGLLVRGAARVCSALVVGCAW